MSHIYHRHGHVIKTFFSNIFYIFFQVRVEICRFTGDENFLITIGGRDDGTINVWDIGGRSTIYNGAAAKITAGDCYGCSAVYRRGRCFITCGDGKKMNNLLFNLII